MMPTLSGARKMSTEEKRWRAEDDARTLSEAEAIKRDPARLKAAQKAAVKLAKEAADKAAGMKKVAGGAYRGSHMRAGKS